MGTRCITVVEDEEGNELCRIFRQFDGYPSVHGGELITYLTRGKVKEQIAMGDDKSFLGMGDVASSLVAYLKSYRKDDTDPTSSKTWRPPTSAGNRIQIIPIGTKDIGEQFIYTVTYQGDNQFPELRVVDLSDGKATTLLS